MPWLRVQAGLCGGCSGREGAAGETRCNPLRPVPQWLAVVDRVTSGAGVRGILTSWRAESACLCTTSAALGRCSAGAAADALSWLRMCHCTAVLNASWGARRRMGLPPPFCLHSWRRAVAIPTLLLAHCTSTHNPAPLPWSPPDTDGLQELQVCRAAHGVVSTHQTPPARSTRLSGAAAHPRTSAACLAWLGRGALLATTTTRATHSRGEPDGWLPYKGSNDIHKTNNEQPMALIGLVAAARANPMRLKPMPASCICLKPMPAPIHLAARTDTTPQSTPHPPQHT